MRRLTAPAIISALLGLGLSACNTGAPQGVLPRTEVPPPPSIAGEGPRVGNTTAPRQTNAARAKVRVPDTLSTPKPSSVEPVMTGSGVGAGFKF